MPLQREADAKPRKGCSRSLKLEKAQTVENSERREHQTTLPASCEICMQVKKQQLEPDMELQEYVKTV